MGMKRVSVTFDPANNYQIDTKNAGPVDMLTAAEVLKFHAKRGLSRSLDMQEARSGAIKKIVLPALKPPQ